MEKQDLDADADVDADTDTDTDFAHAHWSTCHMAAKERNEEICSYDCSESNRHHF